MNLPRFSLHGWRWLALVCALVSGGRAQGLRADEVAADLPRGVRAVWDSDKAYREVTPSRERVCINGLWRWQPATAQAESAPDREWGWFKVPGAWPGITDYMEKDSQTLYRNPAWKEINLAGVTAAWQEREITIPENWSGRRISVETEYLNSFAAVYVDGRKAGEMRFPAGEVDVTAFCAPGKHRLTMLVVAMPLKAVLQSYTDSASARTVKGSVARRGLCGDVFLTATRQGPRIDDVTVETSVRKGEITFHTELLDLPPEKAFRLRARLMDQDKELTQFTSAAFKAADLKSGAHQFAEKWKPKKLWDIHTPTNQCAVVLSLLDSDGQAIDSTAAKGFGFREFWIDGRDFYLNGTRIFLSAVPLDNAEIGAAWATHDAARESMQRLKSFGINFVYTHNYGCEPGSHLSFSEVLRAADDAGMLVALSQPHFSHYEWKSNDADQTNGYAEHARFYASVAGNHPSAVFYSMSHNATGYSEDMNPFMIDGIQNPRDQWAERNAKLALRAEAIVRAFDPSRIVYHHASGNLGAMHDMNFYPNFVPIQELSDWYGHWATNGVKPVFMCEYGAPFTWDWTMYRGWHKGEREFGSAKVPWEYCIAEWNAQFLGDTAYRISEAEKTNLRWEAKQFRAGNTWHRWDYPVQVGSTRFDECYPVFAEYLTDNWRAFRGWGVSGISPWEHEHFWKLRDGVKRAREESTTDWGELQRPGYSPDYIDQRYERMDLAFAKEDWAATPAAQALLRNNMPLLAFIGGKADAFTSKDHNFSAGEAVEKQIIVINNSRETVTANIEWSAELPKHVGGKCEARVATGEQKRIPIRVELPKDLKAGAYRIDASVRFNTGERQADSFEIHVVGNHEPRAIRSKIAVFDPHGETASWLRRKNVPFETVEASTDLASYDLLIVGKRAVGLANGTPNISRVANGLKVLIFEQAGQVLEKRFGFRVEEYGLRNVFARVPDHPALAGIAAENLRDWRGAATLLPPQLDYEMRPRYGPTIQWCDMPVTRVWRCGNRGNVASALIEKPARGNFLPIIDGGYALQYSPLLEFHEGSGMIVFCQLDVTGRSEPDPAAETIGSNLLEYVSSWKPRPSRPIAMYFGEPAGEVFVKAAGLSAIPFDSTKLAPNCVLIAGPQSADTLAPHKDEVTKFINRGGSIVLIGLTDHEAVRILPIEITTQDAEHISSFFKPARAQSAFAGVSCSDVHNRDPRSFRLIRSGAEIVGDGILASAMNGRVVYCQAAPWQFEGESENLRRTKRHASVLLARILANMGAETKTPIVERFSAPIAEGKSEKRWSEGLYLDQPQEWDDPYRFFRW